MTSDAGWDELEAAVEPGAVFTRLRLEMFPAYPVTARAHAALVKLGWSTPEAIVSGDPKKLKAVVGTGYVTWGEIARLRRKIMEARDEQGGG